jgi:N-acetylmuramoyl-L-alanine amidase/putative methionine-R-sulfoxide reductase with GAF domain
MATNPSNTNVGLTTKATQAQDSFRDAKGDRARPTDRREALQALLAFSTLHEQIRRKRAEEARRYAAGLGAGDEAWEFEKFVLDDVLQLVAERALTISGADGIAIALAEGDEIICRASAGTMAPDRGVRLDAKAGFSGACFRTGRIVRCDDSETDPRVNVEACRRLGTRSMVAVPLLGQSSVVGLLEAFSTEPFGFDDGDVRSLNLLAELILAALKPEDEDRIVRAAKVAAAELQSAELESLRQIPMSPPPPAQSHAAEPELREIPLEFSKEDIAPELHIDGTEHLRPALFVVAIVVLLGILLAGGLWWRSRGGAHNTVSAASRSSTTSITGQPGTLSSSISPSAPDASTATTEQTGTASPATGGKASGVPLVTGIRVWSAGGTTTVAIDMQDAVQQDPVQYEKHRLSDPERVYYDLLDTSLAPGVNGKVIDVRDGLVSRIRVAQPVDNVTRVVLETKTGSSFSESREENPHRLVIEVRGPENKEQLQPKMDPLAPPAGPENRTTIVPSTPPTKEDLQLRTRAPKLRIVLDAGHGGWDLGTIGREGLLEKNLVLEVAQRLGDLLESRLGSEVVFTRKDDNYIALEQRAELANKAQADLFVSVHANYSNLLSARGVETYYSSFFSPPEARDIEYRENANAVGVTQAKLTGVELKDKVNESRKLAASVQHALYGALAAQNKGIRDRGVKEASFVVLTGTQMPSILAEISFVSSPADEQRLQSAEYRQQIAEALYKGIERFATTSHRVKMASASGRPAGQ